VLSKRYNTETPKLPLYLRGLPLVRIADGGGFRKSIEILQNAIQNGSVVALWPMPKLRGCTYYLLPGYYGMVHPQASFPPFPRPGHRPKERWTGDDKLAGAHDVGHARPFRTGAGKTGGREDQTLSRN